MFATELGTAGAHVTLNSWQERLEKHFTGIREHRNASDSARPLFALEHGIEEPSELEDLAAQVRTHVTQSAPSDRHWLPWVVYATELGYHYDGDEYWQSFERQTPGWAVYGNRNWIRDCFWEFHKTFRGAKPSGTWADHFSIICWPITHAILPEDLQRQLAQILYEIRYSFRAELFDSPKLLGEAIADRSWRGTSRFQKLAQEPLLLGQIAAALLLSDEDRSRSLILSSTLVRIAKGVNSERRARDWLRDAQAAARVTISGVAKTVAAYEQGPLSGAEELRSLGIEPSIFLRPTGSAWEVFLEIPDLAPLLTRFPSVRTTVSESSCLVKGSSGRPLARGRLFHHGPQTVPLKRWPEPTDILLEFEPAIPELDYLLSAECMLRPGPYWLFKIGPTGLASEIKSHLVRPGNRYVLVSKIAAVAAAEALTPATLNCEDAWAAFIDAPDVLTEPGIQSLKLLGLNAALGVDISPAGVAPVGWDGEGHLEWLSTDRPCICVSSDHPLRGVALNLEGKFPDRIEVNPERADEPLLFELPQLPRGSYKLHVFLQPCTSPDDILTGYIDINVRDPRPWSKGLCEQNPLLVIVDPPNPTLEQLWSGRVKLQLFGPPSRHISCELSLFSSGGYASPAIFRRSLPQLQLPVESDTWQSYFSRIQADVKLQNAYDSAAFCDIQFAAEELGEFSLKCERASSALRWFLRVENKRHVLTLQDSTGAGPPTVVRYGFDRPDLGFEVDSRCADSGLRADEAGGLYVASTPKVTSGIVVPPAALHSLEELRIQPRLTIPSRNSKSLSNLVDVAQLWADAQVTGNLLSSQRKVDVLRAAAERTVAIVCGNEWLKLEHALQRDRNVILDLKTAISRRPIESGLGAALWAKRQEYSQASAAEGVRLLAHLARNYLELSSFSNLPPEVGDRERWVTEFALRLVTGDSKLRAWSAGHFLTGIEYLLKCSTLARSARFLAVCIAVQNNKLHDPLGWYWQ